MFDFGSFTGQLISLSGAGWMIYKWICPRVDKLVQSNDDIVKKLDHTCKFPSNGSASVDDRKPVGQNPGV